MQVKIPHGQVVLDRCQSKLPVSFRSGFLGLLAAKLVVNNVIHIKAIVIGSFLVNIVPLYIFILY